MDDDFVIKENMQYVKSWVANLLVRPPYISFRFSEDAQKRKNRLFQIAFQPPMTYPCGNYATHIPLYLDNKDFVEEINKQWPAFRDLAFSCKENMEKEQKQQQHQQERKKQAFQSPEFKSMSDLAIHLQGEL